MEAGLIVDWNQPWFQPWRHVGEPVLAAWRDRPSAGLAAALNGFGQTCIKFVEASEKEEGESYETFIFRTRTCPTRDNAHDFFNGLAWLAYPHEKTRLNAIQASEIERDGIGARRGPVRDAITILDENGVFLDAPAPLWEALLAREWRRVFIDLRPLWRQARVTVFGHAMLEKLLAPRKDLTSHVWRGAREFRADVLASKPFTPLPLLGIPGWCAENENFSFYDDSLVFRAARARGA